MNTKVFLVILLQLACSGELVKGSCVKGFPYFETTGSYYDKQIDAKYLLLIPDYTFTCHGRVTQWGIYLSRDPRRYERASADFQVWRPEKSGNKVLNCYHFVGNNHVPNFSTERLTVNIPEDEQIEVEPFDIVGVSVSLSTYVIQVGTQRMWYSIVSVAPNPSTSFCLDDPPDPASNMKVTSELKPVMMAVVDTTTLRPTTTESTGYNLTNNTDTGNSTINFVTPSKTSPVTMVTQWATSPVNIETTKSTMFGLVTMNTTSPTASSPTSPPSILGRYGVIVLTLSTSGVLILMITALLITVLVCYRWRRNMPNRQFLANRPLPPIPPADSLQMRVAGVVDSDSESSNQDINEQEREQLFKNTRRNLAYNVHVASPAELINEDNSEDEGYERVGPVCGQFEQL